MRVTLPRALLLASVVTALATVGAGLLLVQPQPQPRSEPRPRPAPVPQPVPQAFAVLAPAAQTSAYGATISWSTPTAATGSVNWGPSGMVPLLWTGAQPSAVTQSVHLEGLAAATRYTATIEAHAADGSTATADVTFTTAAVPSAPRGTVADGTLLVDGDPTFPLLSWEECPDRWAPDIADGIDLFGGNPCTGLANLVAGVAGRALVAGTTDDTPGASGTVGWFYPDEADARGYTADTLPAPGGGGPRFLTLTAHFAAGAATLPQGASVYPGLIARADVVGFDLYPLQELCRPDLLPAVYDAQAQLVQLAWPRPTFQWIEDRQMKCGDTVTPATIRVESWLAIAAGAHALGFFPADWHAPVGPAIHGIARRIRQLEPALLRPAIPVAVAGSPAVRAGARRLNGAVYLIVVNTGSAPAHVTLDGERRVALAPLSVQILVTPPAG